MSPRPLAHFVDQLTARPEISLSEGVGASVTLDGVSSADAATLVSLLATLAWQVVVVDESGYEVGVGELDAGLEPYSVSFQKPVFEQGVGFVATKAFADWLGGYPADQVVVRVASSTVSFRTMGFVVCSWDDVQSGEPSEALKSPRDLVRSVGAVSPLPQDVRPFLMRETKNLPWGDVAFNAWIPVAFRALAYSISAEVEVDALTFIGPPRLILEVDQDWNTDDLGSFGFIALQGAARWVYELDRESEVRHRLFTHEFARVVERGHGMAKAMAESCVLALDGAKITYQYGLHEQSKDAIKSLSELRKAVADETARIAETSRQLALNTAGALFYGLGLLAGKMTTSISPWILDAMAVLGTLYLAAIIATNARFISQQKTLRSSWRQKLYRYLTEAEYKELVTVPVGSAELSVKVILVFAMLLGAAMLFCGIFNDHTDFVNSLLIPMVATN